MDGKPGSPESLGSPEVPQLRGPQGRVPMTRITPKPWLLGWDFVPPKTGAWGFLVPPIKKPGVPIQKVGI